MSNQSDDKRLGSDMTSSEIRRLNRPARLSPPSLLENSSLFDRPGISRPHIPEFWMPHRLQTPPKTLAQMLREDDESRRLREFTDELFERLGKKK